MRVDDVVRRSFVVVVCFMLGVAAYFQASGIMHVVGASIGVDPRALRSAFAPVKTDVATKVPASECDHATSAGAILERNPFDSITGSLLKKDPGPEGGAPAAPAFAEDPYEDPPCDAARVFLISASDDPAWSFAAVAGQGQKPQLRRLGDDVGGLSVLAVVHDRIWLGGGQSRCQAILGANLTSVSQGGTKGDPSRPARVTDPPGPPRSPSPSDRGALPPEIGKKIIAISDREFQVDRSVIADVMERQADLLGGIRVSPGKGQGGASGLRLLGVKPGSLLGSLGVQNGDRLTSINGMDMSDPSKALEMYARLSSSTHLVVNVERGGRPVSLDIAIK